MTVFDDPELRVIVYVLIPQADGQRVLLLPAADGWTLPHFQSKAGHFGAVAHINRTARDQLGMEVTTLRCICEQFDTETKWLTRAYALENHTHEPNLPDGSRWLDEESLDTVDLARPELRAIIQEWFDWTNEDSPVRAPWSRPGWYAMVVDWIDDRLRQLGLPACISIEQNRIWARACLMRIHTSGGDFYFKAAPRMFTYEPVLTRVLNQRHPGKVPDVLAMDVEHSWMLMRDFGGQPLSQSRDIVHWEEALRGFAHIQMDMSMRTAGLISIGCPDRHVDQLVSQIDRFVADRIAMFPNTRAALSQQETDVLLKIIPMVKSRCYDLLDYRLPLSLGHGDLRADNVIVNGGGILYFDWSDSSVTHPFFDLLFLLPDIEQQFPEVPDARNRLRDAYLEPWQAFEPMERLVEALELAQPLAALHLALVCHRAILPGIEPRARWELEHMLPHYLRRLLQLFKRDAES